MYAFNFLTPARIREQYNTGITMMLDKGLGPAW